MRVLWRWWSLVGALLVGAGGTALAAEGQRTNSWSLTDRYEAPNFERFFPRDADGNRKLLELWQAPNKDERSDEEVLRTVRLELRRMERPMSILRWIGNRYIWNKDPQNSDAIEIMYQAADFSGEKADRYGARHAAVYFGLSVVKKKTPAILRTLAELCVRVGDPNDLARVAWGVKDQRAELLKFLEPFLSSNEASVREKARVVEAIFKGELNAFAWARERAKVRADADYRDQLPHIRQTLVDGTSAERQKALDLILRERLTLIMDESFVPAFTRCAEDLSARVRGEIARQAGERWIWSETNQSKAAIELMLRLAEDSDLKVRHNAVYFGLSTVRGKEERVIRRLVDLALQAPEGNTYGRILWGLRDEREKAKHVLREYMAGNDVRVAEAARRVYEELK